MTERSNNIKWQCSDNHFFCLFVLFTYAYLGGGGRKFKNRYIVADIIMIGKYFVQHEQSKRKSH